MKIYRSIKSDRFTQGFGENKACAGVDFNGIAYKPFRIVGTTNGVCPKGYTLLYPILGMKGHNGEDWSLFRGEAIYFNVDINGIRWYGERDTDNEQGIGIRIKSLDPISFLESELPPQITPEVKELWKKQGGKLHVSFLYWHIKESSLADKPLITIGQQADGKPKVRSEIKFGDLIAYGNSTGISGGDHVHTAMKFIDKNGETIGNDNHYYGAVDYRKWFENIFVGDLILIKKQTMTIIELVKNVIASVKAYIALKGR